MNERPEQVIASVRIWLRYAEVDLALSERALQEPALPGPACFHAQQAAEKALKAYLVWLGEVRLPRTHDLEDIAKHIVERGGQTPPSQATALLTDYGVDVRYPDSPPPSPSEAIGAVELCRRVVNFVRGAVGLEGE